MGKLIYNVCDICGIEEKSNINVCFATCSDICDLCFHHRNGGPQSYEYIDRKWKIKQSKIEGKNE